MTDGENCLWNGFRNFTGYTNIEQSSAQRWNVCALATLSTLVVCDMSEIPDNYFSLHYQKILRTPG